MTMPHPEPEPATLTIATSLADQGISCIPIASLRDKRPALPEWKTYQSRVPTDAELQLWFGTGSKPIAMVCGTAQAIDIDVYDEETGHVAEFARICYDLGVGDILDELVCQRSPSGGLHYFFRCDAIPIANSKLASREDGKTLIETRGQGGYILISPSPGYIIERGDLAEIPIISPDDRETILSAARALDRRGNNARESVPEPSTTGGEGQRPGDAYNDDRGAFYELLKAHGWEPVRSMNLWRRPGKSSGVSATWDRIPDRFFVFSSNAYPLEPEHVYTPFSVYAILEHNGDFAAAARELGRRGYGDPPIARKEDIDNTYFTKARNSLESVLSRMGISSQAKLGQHTTVNNDLFTDLTPYLDGNLDPERPTLGAISGGGYLLYRGRLNEIHAEPACGKTNISLAICIQVIRAGYTVLYIDPEDTPRGIVGRLLSFGADPDMIRQRFFYLHNPEPVHMGAAIEWAKVHRPDLVVVDGLAELLAGQQVSENDPMEVLGFFRLALRPFAELGAAVDITDHVTKDAETRGRWARGSGAKMGRYDGAVYKASLVQGYGPHTAGSVNLVVAKDRNGGVGPIGTLAATIHFEPTGSGTAVRIAQPEQFRPTGIIDKITDLLRVNPEARLRDLRELGKAQYVDEAIALLEREGKLRVLKRGRGQPNRYELV